MHDSLGVGVGQRVGDVPQDANRLGDGELALPGQPHPERRPLDVGHDVVEETVGDAGVVQRKDVGVLEVGDDGDFAEKPLGAEGGGKLGAEDLEGDAALVLEVGGEPDGGHASGAQLAL